MAPISKEMAREIAHLMKLFRHPARLRIVTSLAVDGPASPSLLAERFEDLTLGDCNYHCRMLAGGGVATIGRSRKVRGVRERIYQIEPRSNWPFKPRLYPLIAYMLPATTSASEPFLFAMPLKLDARGVKDAVAAIRVTRKKVARIEAAALSRLQDADPANAINAVLTTGFLDAAKFETVLAGGGGGRAT
jgi:hypothetical protein